MLSSFFLTSDNLIKSKIDNKVSATFSDNNTKEIAGSYVEFAERSPLPEFSKLPKNQLKRRHRREGFETGNADRIFESTFTSQLK